MRIVTLAFLISLVAAGLRPALADDHASVEAGRAAARGILIMRDPRICGIALLRDRCIADADTFLRGRGDTDFAGVPKIGPHPATGLRAFVANGDRDALDFALSWINNIQADAKRWAADPRDAALYDAGVLDVFMAAAAAEDDMHQMLGAMPVIDLAKHAALVPPGGLPADTGPLGAMRAEANGNPPNVLRMPQLLPFARDLVRAVERTDPPPPLIALPAANAPAADAEFGIASQSLGELANSPIWLAQADAQRFAADVCDRYDQLLPGPSATAAVRSRLRVDRSYDRLALLKELQAFPDRVEAALPRPRFLRYVLGVAIAQIAYGSAIMRSEANERRLLDAVAAETALDGVIPGWSAARAGGTSISSGDWAAQHAYALRLVSLIQKANRS